jgi:hypothetical protein
LLLLDLPNFLFDDRRAMAGAEFFLECEDVMFLNDSNSSTTSSGATTSLYLRLMKNNPALDTSGSITSCDVSKRVEQQTETGFKGHQR